MQYISQLNSSAPLLPVNLTVNVRRFYNSAGERVSNVFLIHQFYCICRIYTRCGKSSTTVGSIYVALNESASIEIKVNYEHIRIIKNVLHL